MRTTTAAIAVLVASTLSVFAEESRELGAHEHGHVTLFVAVEGQAVAMELEAPGENIVGFEHAAETAEQKGAVEKARAALADPLALFAVPAEAGCTVASADVELHSEGDHNAFEASYALACTAVAAIDRIETKLFTLYPSIEEIEVSYATAAGQGAAELTADSPVLSLPAAN